MPKPILEARKGSVIVFKSHTLRVEAEPVRQGRRIRIEGRESRDGCPYVVRWYFDNIACRVESN